MGNPFDQFDQPAAEANPFDRFDAPAKPKAAPVTAESRVRATVAGVNRGVLSDLIGLPGDAVANVLDLGKAAIGLGYNEAKKLVTGKNSTPPEWSEPFDRAKLGGTSEWFAQKLNDAGLGAAINNPNPEDKASRILHTGGRVAGASVTPTRGLTAAEQAVNAAKGGVSGVLAGAVGEDHPEWAGLAGMAPQIVGMAAPAAIRGAIRGGEAGRKAMVDRMATLKAGGIESPSVGLATGNGFINGVENLLSQTPGSMGLFDRARAANVAGMQAKTEGIRDAISTEHGAVVAGEAIQGDLKVAFRKRTKETAKNLADRVAALVGGDTVVPVDNALAASKRLASPIPGAEATSSEFINPRIAGISENLRTDVYGPRPTQARPLAGNPTDNLPMTPEVPQVAVNNSGLLNIPVEPNTPLAQASALPLRRQPVVMDRIMNVPKPSDPLPPLPLRSGPNPTLNLPMSRAVEQAPVIGSSLLNIPTAAWEPMAQRAQSVGKQPIQNASLWNAQKEQGIPFSALKKLRTSIGDETSSNAIMGTPEQAQFKQLYAAMSEDMRNAAGTADRARAGVPVGPLQVADQPAMVALNRANKHYDTALTRAEELDGLANRSTPEGAYAAVASSLKNGSTIYERLRSAVTPEARQKVAATVINDLGAASPGQQNATGDVWSARTFLTNYNKLYRNGGGQALFTRLPGGETYAKNLAQVAKASEMLGDGAKVWSNPSGTSQALVARGTIGTIGAGAVGGLFYTPLIAPAAVASGTLLLAHQTSQRLLLNPQFVNWLAKAPKVRNPAEMQAYAQRLIVSANMTNDKDFQRDVQEYLDSVGQ